MSKTTVNGILLLYHHNMMPIASNMFEHIRSFQRYGRFQTWAVNTFWGFPAELAEFEFTVIILHYSLFGWVPFPLGEACMEYLTASAGSYKVAFFQDEYRFWPERAACINALHLDCVYTCLEPAYYAATYGKYTQVPRLETYLPGYVSDEMVAQARPVNKPRAARTIDVGYRGRLSLAFIYLGQAALEKYEIAERFQERAAGLGWRLDIETAEDKRIYGPAWLAFLGNCRAVLGVEAGASVFDIDDVVIPAYERLLQTEPGLSPQEAYARVVEPYDGTGVWYRTVSPRVFEAAAAGACQILYEGHYSGVVQPGVHYLALKKDFTNFDEVVRQAQDGVLCERLVAQAERDLIASGAYSYRCFMAQFDAGLAAVGLAPGMTASMVQRINDILWESERTSVVQKFEALQGEQHRLLQQHIALQEQYMHQSKLHQDVLQDYVALQTQYVEHATSHQDMPQDYTTLPTPYAEPRQAPHLLRHDPLEQSTLDTKNAAFWDELCGSSFARLLGITEITPATLRQFDAAYLAFYPYLSGYVTSQPLQGKKVLEIGLGYGTLGQLLAEQGCEYYGLDIAQGPVDMMRYRLQNVGYTDVDNTQRGSALAIAHPAEFFDYVYTIGCLHHTGNVRQAMAEVYRVLRPGGAAVVMLYNRHSFRQLVHIPLTRLGDFLTTDKRSVAERVRALYDTNAQGEAAPHTDYVSRREVRRLCNMFSRVKIDRQNFDTYVFWQGKLIIPREKLLHNVARLLGLDLYITATK